MSNPEDSSQQKITRLVSSEQVSGLSAWSAQALMTPEQEQKLAAQKAADKAKYEQDYNNGFDKGFQEGLLKGQQEGLAQGEAKIREEVASLEQVIEYFSDPYLQLDEAVSQNLVSLVQLITERVVQREMALKPETILNIVKEGLKHLPQTHQSIKVYLNPSDSGYVEQYLASEPEKWTLVQDMTLAPGNCRIESESTKIDATLATQIQQAMDSLLNSDENA